MIPMRALTIRLPEDLHEKLHQLAYMDRTSMNTIITQALYEFLDEDKEITR